jgi:protein-tyrosine phosphatase
MPSVLFVCTANMCRSPLAEVLFRDLLRRNGLQGDWRVHSAGVGVVHGQPATEFSRQVAADRGLDLSSHISKPVDRASMQAADLVLVMDSGHRQALREAYPQSADRVHLLSEMAGEGGPVEDPVGSTIEKYRLTADRITDLLTRGLDRIRDLAARPAAQEGHEPND